MINRTVLVGRLTRDPDLRTRINHNGYVEVYLPRHHRARGNGYVFEHILVAEEKTGRKLKGEEVVHHINEDKTDNNPSNLRVMNRSDHSRMHSKNRPKTGVHLNCEHCQKEFYIKLSRLARARFCSMECNGHSSSVAQINNEYITKDELILALKNNDWHKKNAAKELGIHWGTIYKNIKKLGVECN